MSLRNLDIESAMRRLADQRIEQAMNEGKFDNLPGAGQPLELDPLPADENARMMWWALKLMRQNDLIPDEIRYRKRIDSLRAALHRADAESSIRRLVHEINALVRQLNTMGTNAIKSEIAPLDLEAELSQFRRRMQS